MAETAHTKTHEATRCIYCNQPLESEKFVLNPKAHTELYCCDAECLSAAKAFAAWDSRSRTRFYLLEMLFIVANLWVIGYSWTSAFQYVPLMGMGAVLWRYPLPFMHYTSYQRFGIARTQRIIRMIAVGIVLLGGLLTIF